MLKKYTLLISILVSITLLNGCVSPIEKITKAAPDLDKTQITLGKIQQTLKKGMNQADIIAAVGSPNLVTKDKNGLETWVYDKLKTEVTSINSSDSKSIEAGALNTSISDTIVGVAGTAGQTNSASNTIRTQKTLTVILKFKNNKLEEYSYQSTSF